MTYVNFNENTSDRSVREVGNAMVEQPAYVLAFDTANEVIAIGLGILRVDSCVVEVTASVEVAAHRASNTQLLPRIDALLNERGIDRNDIACVVVGRGPGSFTGVRIAMATAKGIASALEVALVGVSSLDAVAWSAHRAGVRGELAVVADAMRKEVYPVRYALDEMGAKRLEADRVLKAEAAAQELADSAATRSIAGDALVKYAELFAPAGTALSSDRWSPTGTGLLAALQAAWQSGAADPLDARSHHPALTLPVYTRLSDAEENERIRLAKNDSKNLSVGVQDVEVRRDQRASMHDTAIMNAQPSADGILYKPLDAAHAAHVAALETAIMGTDAWNESLVLDELPRKDRVWWAAYGPAACQPPTPLDAAASCGTQSCHACDSLRTQVRGANASEPILGTTESLADLDGPVSQKPIPLANFGGPARELLTSPATLDGPAREEQRLIGYAGGWIIEGDVQILKVGVDPAWRRHGVARELLARVAQDARDLGAATCSLEVRAGNIGAQGLYKSLGLKSLGTRARYYSDGEDARIMQGPLPVAVSDVAGMALQVHDTLSVENASTGKLSAKQVARPLILALETSCDETAAAIVDGSGNLVADVVASQIDFHARFGGVVPEIASRKHIEAICGVCDECFDVAAANLGLDALTWRDLDSVAVTYAPGLMGALVVGVAFAKGAAWGASLPFIGVNHLEGHLYANKIGTPDLVPPAVVSLVSGGNTLLVHMKDWGSYETLGATIDDAVGEAFDKVAKALGLGYPGGPIISQKAAEGNPKAVAFPRAMLHSGDLRFSLSGLKTAVVTYINKERAAGRPLNIPDIAASFQQAVVDVQVAKAKRALEQTGAREFCLGGGVAANPVLRAAYRDLCNRMKVRLTLPPLSACTDNAGMIALVALDRYRQAKFYPLNADAQAHANLDDAY